MVKMDNLEEVSGKLYLGNAFSVEVETLNGEYQVCIYRGHFSQTPEETYYSESSVIPALRAALEHIQSGA